MLNLRLRRNLGAEMGSSGCDLWFHHLFVRLQSNIDWDRAIATLAGEVRPYEKTYDVGTVTCHFQMIVSQSIVDLGCTERLWVTDHKQWQHYEALRPLTSLIRGACWCCNTKCFIFDQHQNAQMTTLGKIWGTSTTEPQCLQAVSTES
jgi:hypothetical protein